jgi:predicted KAP-like P-loop ATPase
VFSPDRPIQSAADDLLGRSSFASLLAEKISQWRGRESLVIALYGEWGSGKSSVKNLILEKLAEEKYKPLEPIHFNPWVASGVEKITQNFLYEIGVKLSRENTEDATQRAAKWKRYAGYLEFGSNISNALESVLPGAGFLHKALDSLNNAAKKRAESYGPNDKTLEQMRSELRKEFKSLNAPIVVVIDDIDRLTEDEITLVFRLVKANADFPNLIFLLLFQRETAEAALNKVSGNQGRLFLEKIVQVGIDLPPPSRDALSNLLFRGINETLEPLVNEDQWDRERFTEIWFPGLSHYFGNLREVYRFLSSLSFAVSAFSQGGVLEVNPVDLVAIETLRIGEPKVYEAIRQNKFPLVDRGARRPNGSHAELAENLLASSDRPKDVLQSILKQLFPVLQEVWDNWSYSSEFVPSWIRDRRICTERFFDRYFLLGVPPDQVAETTIEQILHVSSDRAALNTIFEDLRTRGLILDALDRLEAEERLATLPDPFPYIVALADISDFLPTKKVWFASFRGDVYPRRALARALRTIQNDEAKRSLVIKLIEESHGLFATARWIQAIETPDSDSALPQISIQECNRLKQVWLFRVRAAADSGYLYKVEELFPILWFWQQCAGPGEAQAWVLSALGDDRKAVTLLRGFIAKASSFNLRGYSSTDQSSIDPKILEGLSPFAEWENLETRLAGTEAFNTEEQRVINLFKQAMENWRQSRKAQ